MKTIDLRKKSTDDLEKELLEIRKAQFSIRMQISTQQSTKNDQIGKFQKDIAKAIRDGILDLIKQGVI
jgi:large subunit ribosomal protein L29